MSSYDEIKQTYYEIKTGIAKNDILFLRFMADPRTTANQVMELRENFMRTKRAFCELEKSYSKVRRIYELQR